jgi:hypothetical protein
MGGTGLRWMSVKGAGSKEEDVSDEDDGGRCCEINESDSGLEFDGLLRRRGDKFGGVNLAELGMEGGEEG